ncbi:hypothetical protein CROQUDRAFT_663900, partial [Cronartium quercuum f. sp. fusiforme G11]
MSKRSHCLIDPSLLDMAATTLSTASLAFLTSASVLEPIIPAAQTRLNTTTHNEGWINS